MSRAPATPLHAARRAAAKELALPITDWRVIRLATLVCAHDAVQAGSLMVPASTSITC